MEIKPAFVALLASFSSASRTTSRIDLTKKLGRTSHVEGRRFHYTLFAENPKNTVSHGHSHVTRNGITPLRKGRGGRAEGHASGVARGRFGKPTYVCRPPGYRAAPPIAFWATQVERFSETWPFWHPSVGWSQRLARFFEGRMPVRGPPFFSSLPGKPDNTEPAILRPKAALGRVSASILATSGMSASSTVFSMPDAPRRVAMVWIAAGSVRPHIYPSRLGPAIITPTFYANNTKKRELLFAATRALD